MHNHNYAQAVVQLLQNRLKLSIDIGDIMDVHPLPTRNKIPPLIVKFMRPFNLEQVLKARRNLKVRGIGISEDLTRRNIQLLNRVKKQSRSGRCLDTKRTDLVQIRKRKENESRPVQAVRSTWRPTDRIRINRWGRGGQLTVQLCLQKLIASAPRTTRKNKFLWEA